MSLDDLDSKIENIPEITLDETVKRAGSWVSKYIPFVGPLISDSISWNIMHSHKKLVADVLIEIADILRNHDEKLLKYESSEEYQLFIRKNLRLYFESNEDRRRLIMNVIKNNLEKDIDQEFAYDNTIDQLYIILNQLTVKSMFLLQDFKKIFNYMEKNNEKSRIKPKISLKNGSIIQHYFDKVELEFDYTDFVISDHRLNVLDLYHKHIQFLVSYNLIEPIYDQTKGEVENFDKIRSRKLSSSRFSSFKLRNLGSSREKQGDLQEVFQQLIKHLEKRDNELMDAINNQKITIKNDDLQVPGSIIITQLGRKFLEFITRVEYTTSSTTQT